jgi:hypothetical protein
MGFKEELSKETKDLQNVKRPYESAAFILFAILIVQQLFFLFKNLFDFIKPANTWFSTANITNTTNNQAFFSRIINIDSSSWIYVILALVGLGLYYFLVYAFVWNYCRKRGLAKWTWTLFVVFGPGIFLAPAYIWYTIYVFRPYIFRFIKRGVEEYKAFNPNQVFKEEVPEPAPEPKVTIEPEPQVEE